MTVEKATPDRLLISKGERCSETFFCDYYCVANPVRVAEANGGDAPEVYKCEQTSGTLAAW